MKKEKGCLLTEANIQKITSLNHKILKVPLSHFKQLDEYPYILVIKSITVDFIKITLYPLKKKRIIKISIRGKNVPKEEVLLILNKLQSYEIVHSSGLCYDSNNQLLYECYLNIDFSTSNVNILQKLLNQYEKNFESILIDEITLKKRKGI